MFLTGFSHGKKSLIYIIIAIIISILTCTTIASSIQSYKSRVLCGELRERIIDAENTNRELAETIEQCGVITKDLGESVDRNINSARDAVELIEEIRVQVQSLENIIGGWDSSDDYYNQLDNYLGLE